MGAAVDIRHPENMQELRSLLGLVNYSARFILEFCTVCEPLRKLTQKDAFGKEPMMALSVLNRKLIKCDKAAHFDKEAPTRLALCAH